MSGQERRDQNAGIQYAALMYAEAPNRVASAVAVIKSNVPSHVEGPYQGARGAVLPNDGVEHEGARHEVEGRI